MEFTNVKGIAIYGTDCVVDISRGDDDVCRFVSAKEKYFNIQQDNNGLLTVAQKKGNIFYRIIMRRFEFKLILSKNFVGRLRFRNKNGGIYINGGGFADVELSTKNGNVDVENISCADFSLKVRNGSAIKLKSVTAAADINVKCDNGNIKAENVKAAAVDMSCHNASISVADVKARKLDCSTNNGAVDANAIDADALRLETSNGKISAVCAGSRDEYRLSLETTHGTITLDGTPSKNITDIATGTSRRADLRTSNGDIDIRFV